VDALLPTRGQGDVALRHTPENERPGNRGLLTGR
jgi:hypothetical protein